MAQGSVKCWPNDSTRIFSTSLFSTNKRAPYRSDIRQGPAITGRTVKKTVGVLCLTNETYPPRGYLPKRQEAKTNAPLSLSNSAWRSNKSLCGPRAKFYYCDIVITGRHERRSPMTNAPPCFAVCGKDKIYFYRLTLLPTNNSERVFMQKAQSSSTP